MDEKEWMMTPPNNWKSEKVVDALLKIESDDTDSIGEALSPLDEYVADLQATADRLRGLLKEMAEKQGSYYRDCLICGRPFHAPHADDCRLAKELNDE